jgi:hypothetical protein
MLRHGLSRDDIEPVLDQQREFFAADRADHLNEIRARLLGRDTGNSLSSYGQILH